MNISKIGCLVFFEILSLALAEFRFTNIKCLSLDESFCRVEYCYMKSVNRTYKYISAKAKLLQLPVTNVTLDYALMRRENGYKPFLYNGTIDGCKFLRNPKRYPVVNYFYSMVYGSINFNHSCPYDHDLVLDKLVANSVNHHVTNVLPVPKGEYAFYLIFSAYNVKRTDVKVYGTLS